MRPSPLLRLAALALPMVLAACAAEEDALSTFASRAGSVALDAGDVEDSLTFGGLPQLPPVLQEITEHVRPVLSTDGSHDIPNAAASHDADLDREAAEGMAPLPRRTGLAYGKERAATDLDESIAAARVRLSAPADAGALE